MDRKPSGVLTQSSQALVVARGGIGADERLRAGRTHDIRRRLSLDQVGSDLSSNMAVLFHEALHGFGASIGSGSYYDDQLQTAFGLPHTASSNITDYIRTNCF
jgi:hypothetical protein